MAYYSTFKQYQTFQEDVLKQLAGIRAAIQDIQKCVDGSSDEETSEEEGEEPSGEEDSVDFVDRTEKSAPNTTSTAQRTSSLGTTHH